MSCQLRNIGRWVAAGIGRWVAVGIGHRVGGSQTPGGGWLSGIGSVGITALPATLFVHVSDLSQQLQTYVDLGFDVAGIRVPADAGPDGAVLVMPHAMVPFHELITRLHLAGSGKPGIFDRNFEDPGRYRPVDPDVPRARPYLIHGFEPGVEYLNEPPRDAIPSVLGRGRLPATIEEGLAMFVQWPEILQRNECFSLAGSTRGDKRVPALWISGNAPKLGWCFAGAPHTWLGTASIAGRLALS